MERWLLVAGTNCTDLSQEKEFNHWYDNIHLPDSLETPGPVRAARYENSRPGEGQGKFLALPLFRHTPGWWAVAGPGLGRQALLV